MASTSRPLDSAPAVVSPDVRDQALRTLNLYCDLVDTGHNPIEAFAMECTADYGLRRGPVHGREALARFFDTNKNVLRHTSHHVSSVRVHRLDPDGSGVQLRAHVLAWHELTDGRTFDVHGRYDDVLVEENGRLLIAYRRFRTYGSSDPSFSFARAERSELV